MGPLTEAPPAGRWLPLGLQRRRQRRAAWWERNGLTRVQVDGRERSPSPQPLRDSLWTPPSPPLPLSPASTVPASADWLLSETAKAAARRADTRQGLLPASSKARHIVQRNGETSRPILPEQKLRLTAQSPTTELPTWKSRSQPRPPSSPGNIHLKSWS